MAKRRHSPHIQEDLRISLHSRPTAPHLAMASGLCSSLGLLLIVCLQSPPGFSAFPQIPLASLLNNAVIRAQYIHQVVADTYRDYERTFIREDKRYSNKNSYAMFCYSETIPAPTDKDNTHQKSDMDLLRFSLTLIQSWMTPVQSLNKLFTNQVFGNAVYEKLRDLEEGLYALMRELDDGNARNFGLLTFTYDKFDPHPDSDDDARVKNYGLLSCFKKDMHKVETYLKVMKCRRFVESNCMV